MASGNDAQYLLGIVPIDNEVKEVQRWKVMAIRQHKGQLKSIGNGWYRRAKMLTGVLTQVNQEPVKDLQDQLARQSPIG